MKIQFVDTLPARPKSTRAYSIPQWVKLCKNNPGQWAKVENYRKLSTARAKVQQIRSGGLACLERGEFEAQYRSVGGGNYPLYVRYVGQDN